MEKRIHSFDPVWDARACVLVLGTMPSVKSLEQSFYYAHPQNAFWRIISDVFGAPLPTEIEHKKALLLDHRIALWDVAASCVREGSLDSAMRAVEMNDIEGLLRQCPRVSRILLNGGTAFSLFQKHLGHTGYFDMALRMPSTSPAYFLPYREKLEAWAEGLTDGGLRRPSGGQRG